MKPFNSIVLACLLALSRQVLADDAAVPSVKIQKYLDSAWRKQGNEISKVEGQLAVSQKAMKAARSFTEKKRIKSQIDDLLEKVSALKRGQGLPVATLDPGHLEMGDIGAFPATTRLIVAQVIDKDTVHIIPELWKMRIQARGLAMSQDNYKALGNRFIIRGRSTMGIVDNVTFDPQVELFEVTGTEKYSTSDDGTNTVFVLKPFDKKIIDDIIAKTAAAMTDGTKKEKASGLRIWTDATEKFSVKAEFVELKDGLVSLQKENGEVISVPFARLHQRAKDWIKENTQ